MIGVLANAAERRFVEEFFELFKTPWEMAVPGRRYAVLLSTDGQAIATPGTLTLIYGAGETPWDRENGVRGTAIAAPQTVTWSIDRIQRYGPATTFATSAARTRNAAALMTPHGAVDIRVESPEST